MRKLMKASGTSWQTTIGGLLAAVGIAVLGLHANGTAMPDWVVEIAPILGVIGAAMAGITARDNGVSSKDAGAE